MRVNLSVKNPLISILSETMVNHDQDVISISTDLTLLYKKEKIQIAKEELYKNYLNLSKVSMEKEEDKILLNKDIACDNKEIYVLVVSLYDICPFVCSLNDILNTKRVIFPRRKLMNYFNFQYESKTILQYSYPNSYIQSNKSSIDIKKITIKFSYRDLVLFLKSMEYNMNLMDKEYEEKIQGLTNSKREVKEKSNEKEYRSIDRKSDINTKRRSTLLSRLNKDIDTTADNIHIINALPEPEQKIISRNKNTKDVIIDKGNGLLTMSSGGVQIVNIIY